MKSTLKSLFMGKKLLGNMANKAAISSEYTMKNHTGLDFPLNNMMSFDPDTGNEDPTLRDNHANLLTVTKDLTYNGKTEQIEGWYMPPQDNKPVMVYYGGSEFDRESPKYQSSILDMAQRCQKEGMGFAVFDYPKNPREDKLYAAVDATEQFLDAQGIDKAQRAYTGYSLGGAFAVDSAVKNPEACGVQLVSTFSSIKDVALESIKESTPKVISKRIHEKPHWLTEELNNIDRIKDINPDMPVHMTHSYYESFGDNHKHMNKLVQEAQGANLKLDQSTLYYNQVDTETNNIDPGATHLGIMQAPETKARMSNFLDKASTHYEQQLGQVVDVQKPQVQTAVVTNTLEQQQQVTYEDLPEVTPQTVPPRQVNNTITPQTITEEALQHPQQATHSGFSETGISSQSTIEELPVPVPQSATRTPNITNEQQIGEVALQQPQKASLSGMEGIKLDGVVKPVTVEKNYDPTITTSPTVTKDKGTNVEPDLE